MRQIENGLYSLHAEDRAAGLAPADQDDEEPEDNDLKMKQEGAPAKRPDEEQKADKQATEPIVPKYVPKEEYVPFAKITEVTPDSPSATAGNHSHSSSPEAAIRHSNRRPDLPVRACELLES